MEKVQINFAHMCDLAFLSQGGKANVIGIFKAIFSNNFPTLHPKFSVITSITMIDATGNHRESIKIIREEDKKEIFPEINFDFNLENNKEKEKEINLISDIINVQFEKPGKYSIKISLDGENVHSLPFEVVKS